MIQRMENIGCIKSVEGAHSTESMEKIKSAESTENMKSTADNQRNVLDKGFIKCVGTFGNELTVVNAARVSFGVHKENIDEKDRKLMKYLIEHGHFSPFRHIFVRLHIKASEFVIRQW